MTTLKILGEIVKLPLPERIKLAESILRNIRMESQSLASGAKALLEDYKTDKELTAFGALDMENFYEAR